MYRFSRNDRHMAIFAQMRDRGETITLMYLYKSEIKKLIRNHYFVLPQKAHHKNPHLILCEVRLPKED